MLTVVLEDRLAGMRLEAGTFRSRLGEKKTSYPGILCLGRRFMERTS